MIINILHTIEAKRIKLVQNFARLKQNDQVSPKLLEIEETMIALNFTGSNRERRKLFRSLGTIGIDLFAEVRSTLTASTSTLTASTINLTATIIFLPASIITLMASEAKQNDQYLPSTCQDRNENEVSFSKR
jgi:hypothetical protein